jgi:sec-independent protein translocase protein TatB
MRSIGHYAGKLRRAASDFQRQFEQAMRESEVEEVRKAIESVKVDAPPLDQPVMLPKPAEPAAPAKPKPARKRAAAKPRTETKVASAKRGKKRAEPAR